MCGFVATISRKDVPFPEDKLRTMTGMIVHRGPDDESFFFSEKVSLGFRRLKIIDLTDNAN
ncbi:MAG TPA: hypothetical protein P5239_06635 [Victivallales bacterium]|nr:hypothetical protein [Victivallales bacterium]